MGICNSNCGNNSKLFSDDIPLKSAQENKSIVTDKMNISNLNDSQNALLSYLWDEDVMFCISDARKEDMPIHYVSNYFCKFTGYSREEIIGRNCRFLQGQLTKQSDVDKIRKAIIAKKPGTVQLINYRKDGRVFNNEFYIAPLFDKDNELAYFLGIQTRIMLKSVSGNEVEQSVFFNADGVLHSIVRKTSLAKDFHALFQCHDARDDDGTETKYQEE